MVEFLTLPEGVSQAVFLAMIGFSFLGSFITVALGIGGGVMLLALLASVMPPAALIPVHGVVQLGSNAGRAAMLFRNVQYMVLPALVAGMVVGAAVGGRVAVALPPGIVQIGIGLFVIWSVLSKPPAWLKRWPFVTGLVSAFLTMFFGATGPFVASFVKSLQLDRHAHTATHAAVMTFQHMLKVLVFGFLGFAFGEWAFVVVAMILAGLVGTFTGKQVLNRMSDKNFKTALNTVLFLLSVRLIWAGASDLWLQN